MQLGQRFYLGGDFVLLLTVLLAWQGEQFLFLLLSAWGLHELGHYLALRLSGGRVALLSLGLMGAELRPAPFPLLSYPREIVIALAGPACSLAAAALCAALARLYPHPPLFLWTGFHLAAGLFNLLPVLPLDGGRFLWLLLSRLWGPDRGLFWLTVLGRLFGLSLVLLCLLCARHGAPVLWLLPLPLRLLLLPAAANAPAARRDTGQEK